MSFDDFARFLAGPWSRRKALRAITTIVASAAVVGAGATDARADCDVCCSDACPGGACIDGSPCCCDADGEFRGCCGGECCYDFGGDVTGCCNTDAGCCGPICCPDGTTCCNTPDGDPLCCTPDQVCADGGCVPAP